MPGVNLTAPTIFKTEVALAAIVGILVKACYAMRVWRFSNRNILVTGVIRKSLIEPPKAYVVKSFELKLTRLTSFMWNKFSLTPKLRIYAAFSLASGVLTDIITAGALSFFLRRMRTGFKTSDSLVNKLTVYAINTGALTGAISLTTLLLYNLRPNDFYFMAFYFVLAKFYAISLLCTLNTRKSIRGKGTDQEKTPSKVIHGRGNSFYMVDVNTQSARPMVRSHTESQIKSIEIGALHVETKQESRGGRITPGYSPDPSSTSSWMR
ncbi:hypothetical protein D9615_002659 [Tricholomella constricta]|uniref:DUF6534 domain-containing protein n=1 Tax=Tricholomella constricta TaxID=117010 RepID=A0A8H5HNB1_9AGAR|nr:hypothetical protein D9615_002659 [Tricholomella constricta]